MRLRIRGPSGQSTATFAQNATTGDLQAEITKATSIQVFDVKYGYPPKPLLLDDYLETTKLSDLSIKLDGEQLIVSERFAPKPPQQPPQTPNAIHKREENTCQASNAASALSASNKPLTLERKPMSNDAPELALPSHSSTVILRIMPDDNSCLFRAFGAAFFGGMDNVTELRSIIAQTIQTNPDDYPDWVLDGQKPDDYCRWIQTEDAWGGAIELNILSKEFDLEICSIDVQTLRVDRFNEGRPSRCILVYSGIHYDTIALSPSDPPHDRANAPPEIDVKIFDSEDQGVLGKAVELCKVLQKQHYFTDTANFGVKCNVCKENFKGEKGATEHAKATGHYDFGEAR